MEAATAVNLKGASRGVKPSPMFLVLLVQDGLGEAGFVELKWKPRTEIASKSIVPKNYLQLSHASTIFSLLRGRDGIQQDGANPDFCFGYRGRVSWVIPLSRSKSRKLLLLGTHVLT